jgi:hypothetical protein
MCLFCSWRIQDRDYRIRVEQTRATRDVKLYAQLFEPALLPDGQASDGGVTVHRQARSLDLTKSPIHERARKALALVRPVYSYKFAHYGIRFPHVSKTFNFPEMYTPLMNEVVELTPVWFLAHYALPASGYLSPDRVCDLRIPMLGNRRLGHVLVPIRLRDKEPRKGYQLFILRQVFDDEGSHNARPGFYNIS